MNLELRYIKTGNAYIPQYKKDEKSDWNCFTAKQVPKKSLLYGVSKALGDTCTDTAVVKNAWDHTIRETKLFLEYKEQDVIFFLEEILVMAFLGAAKSYYTQEVKEFSI